MNLSSTTIIKYSPSKKFISLLDANAFSKTSIRFNANQYLGNVNDKENSTKSFVVILTEPTFIYFFSVSCFIRNFVEKLRNSMVIL